MRKYDKYKDSGIAWIGEIPEGWEVCLFKRIVTLNNGSDYKDIISYDNGYPVIGSGGQFAQATKYIYDGEAVLLGRKGTIDRPLYFKGKFWVVDTMFYGIPKKNKYAKFVYYQSLTIPFNRYSTSTALPSMTQTDLNNNPVALPPLPEQQSIAAYLDNKVGEIDGMIEKTEKKIALYEELKKSIITRAVTKGLNPHAKMKDSGVEWIGEIPEGWETCKLKNYLIGLQDGTHGTYERVDSEYPLLSAKNIYDYGLEISNSESTISKKDNDSIIANGYPQRGDIALCCVGTIGRCCIYKFDKKYAFQRSVTFLRCNSNSNNRYLLYLLKSMVCLPQYDMFAKTSAQSGIYMGALSNFVIIRPPLHEQQAIATYLDTKTTAIDSQIAIARKRIDLLKELKSSLITQVVTGKMKVC